MATAKEEVIDPIDPTKDILLAMADIQLAQTAATATAAATSVIADGNNGHSSDGNGSTTSASSSSSLSLVAPSTPFTRLRKNSNAKSGSFYGDGPAVAFTPSANLDIERLNQAGSVRATVDVDERAKRMEDAVKTLLECIGEDPTREGLLNTPKRMAKALLYFTKGYDQQLEQVVGSAIFEEDHHEMILVKNIEIYSLCEHHMVPFMGKCHIAYIPRSRVLGLSKLARIAEMYTRRLQVQERLTKQVAEAIKEAVNPLGVAVVIEASHMCMVMRGVEKAGAMTITSSLNGCFQSDPKTRAEFFSLVGMNRA